MKTKRKDRDRTNVWKKQNAEHVRAYRRRVRLALYRLDAEAFERMRAEQFNLCAICVGPLLPGKGTQIDHCHKTGRVRGLLCPGCNVGLGMFQDGPLRLRLAAAYVERNT